MAAGNTKSSQPLLVQLLRDYRTTTDRRVQIIDAYMVFLMLTGILQFAHILLAGSYPYNAFLSGFSSTVGAFVFAAAPRVQTNPRNTPSTKSISPERAFADFIFCNLLLFLAVANFLG